MTATNSPEPGSQLKILVVEDSRTQAERLRHILQQQDYQVSVAANGRLALEALPTFTPDLVISDINMPEMDGYELSKRMKAMPDFHEVPVILVTTMSDPRDVIRGLECGADNFVLKPYEERYMLGRVRYVLANREMRRPDDAAIGVYIFFNGQRHFITADRLQILNLLLSTYEAAIQRNRELTENKESLEQQSAEISLANRFLDQVIENIPHMIFVKDALDLRYVRVNRASLELVGLTKEKMIGRSDYEIFPSQQADAFTAQDREVLGTGATSAHDDLIQTPHRGQRMVNTRKLVIKDEFDKPRFLLGISEDVTEKTAREQEFLRLNEALRQRTAEADAAARAKSTFLSTMSHEIRTPMNGMLGMLELLSLTKLDPDQRATLDIVRESSTSLLRIVDDVLDFSKIEAGQLEIHPEPASIPRILKEVERTFAGAATVKGLVVRAVADPDIAPALMLDALRLRQILNNFVSNAIKFTNEGSVEIVAEHGGRGANGLEQVRILVRDTGIGISKVNQQRLFQPFSQGDAEAARRAGGTGLGLSICRRLAEMMGGSVEMHSELGHGTTMTLRLSLEVAEAAALPVALDSPPSACDARWAVPDTAQAERDGTLVLLVDDHPTNRMLLLRQLNVLGYAAETAEDGEKALALWRYKKHGLVITDCEMPRMNGYELAQAVRQEETGTASRRTIVIACTAHALEGEGANCLAAGMDDFLIKPIDLNRLDQKLQQWLPPAPLEGRAGRRNGSGAGADLLDLSLVRTTWGEGEAAVREILSFFQRANNADCDLLRRAIGARDLALLGHATHRMLGAGRSVGAHAFADVCNHIEQACRAGDWQAVDARLQQFEAELGRLNAYIDSVSAVAQA